MTLWILLAAMTLVAAAGLAIPLFRRPVQRPAGGGAVEVLKDQLAAIDARTRARGLTDPEAEALRLEIARRILAEGTVADAEARPLGARSRTVTGVALAAILALGAAGLYLMIGRPDLTGPQSAAPAGADAAAATGADLAGMVGQLEAKMKASPGDPRGWRLLGWADMQLGRSGKAADAYGRASALEPANGEYLSARGEALVQAAGGQVTAAALSAFKGALVRNPTDPRARYFLAMARDQAGDHAGAMDDWIALLKSAPPNAPWAVDVRASVERIARQNGEDIAARLPAPTDAGADQAAMIAGMVGRLAAHLKADPTDADGWVAMMRARMVLGDTAAASGAYRDALRGSADSPSRQAALRAAARGLGVPGA